MILFCNDIFPTHLESKKLNGYDKIKEIKLYFLRTLPFGTSKLLRYLLLEGFLGATEIKNQVLGTKFLRIDFLIPKHLVL